MNEIQLKRTLEHIGAMLEKSQEISWFKLHYNRFLETLKNFTDNVPKGAYVLEVGCSLGILTIAVKQLGYVIKGLDLNPEEFFEYSDLEGVTILRCDIEKERVPFNDDSFDAVLFTEVIEHLNYYHVKHALSEIKRVLKEGGMLILSTPNIAALENHLFLLIGGVSFLGGGIINPAHNREYTKKEILNILHNVGFKVEKSWYSMARDVVTHVTNEYMSREHILKSFSKHRHWINLGRVIAFPLKLAIPAFRSTIFVLARKPKRDSRK